MEPNREFIYKDESRMSPQSVKKLGRFMLYTTLFLLVVQVFIFLFRDWAVYTLINLCPAIILLHVALFAWIGLNSLEIWVADGHLYWKKTLNFMKPKEVPLKDIKMISIEKERARYKNQNPYISTVLNMSSGKKVYVTIMDRSSQAYTRALKIRAAIEKAHPKGPTYWLNLGNGNELIDIIQSFPEPPSNLLHDTWPKNYSADGLNTLTALNSDIAVAPDNAALYLQRSLLYHQLGMWQEAWADLEKHAELLPVVTTFLDFVAYENELKGKIVNS